MNFSYPQLSTENVLVSQVILEFLLFKFFIGFSDESGSLISWYFFPALSTYLPIFENMYVFMQSSLFYEPFSWFTCTVNFFDR